MVDFLASYLSVPSHPLLHSLEGTQMSAEEAEFSAQMSETSRVERKGRQTVEKNSERLLRLAILEAGRRDSEKHCMM